MYGKKMNGQTDSHTDKHPVCRKKIRFQVPVASSQLCIPMAGQCLNKHVCYLIQIYHVVQETGWTDAQQSHVH